MSSLLFIDVGMTDQSRTKNAFR